MARVNGVSVAEDVEGLSDYIAEAVAYIREKLSLDTLTSHPLVRAYRDFFWRMDIDPTKTRPSAEALVRRVLQGKAFPRVNTLVDTYNVVSMTRMIPIAAFDVDRVMGDLLMRFARRGEKFLGIGMAEPVELSGKELVVEDGEKLIAIYPYRDADSSKVTTSTKNVLLMVCGAPGVSIDYLNETSNILVDSVRKFCGGWLVWKNIAKTA